MRVPLDEAARQAVLDAVARTRELRSSTERPPIAENDRLCLRLARRLAMAKLETTLRCLLRATRGTDRQATGVAQAAESIRESLRRMAWAEGVITVRGHEGMAAQAYFGGSVPLADPPPPPAPEASTPVLLATGTVGLLLVWRRRRHTA